MRFYNLSHTGSHSPEWQNSLAYILDGDTTLYVMPVLYGKVEFNDRSSIAQWTAAGWTLKEIDIGPYLC